MSDFLAGRPQAAVEGLAGRCMCCLLWKVETSGKWLSADGFSLLMGLAS